MYYLSYPEHVDPTDHKTKPSGVWLIDGDTLPLNVKGDSLSEDIVHHKASIAEPYHARRLVTAIKDAWNLRQEAAKAVVAG